MNILWIIIWVTVISSLYECTSRMIDEQKEYNEKYPITTTYENEISSIGLIDGCEVKHVKQLEVKTQNEKRYPTVLKEFDMAKCGNTTTKTETIEKQVVSGKVISSKKEQHTTITNEVK